VPEARVLSIRPPPGQAVAGVDRDGASVMWEAGMDTTTVTVEAASSFRVLFQ
jgi:hypothetical protein